MVKFLVNGWLPRASRFVCALTLAGSVLLLFGGVPAQGKILAPCADVLNIASLMLVPLPNQSMNQIKGGGLQGPGLGGAASSAGTITLWDELKPPGQTQNAGNGTITITVNNLSK